jgi:hypothetical protein
MALFHRFFAFSAILAFLLLLTGLYKPWVVLGWMARQNRMGVIRLYGSILALSIAGYLAIDVLNK